LYLLQSVYTAEENDADAAWQIVGGGRGVPMSFQRRRRRQ